LLLGADAQVAQSRSVCSGGGQVWWSTDFGGAGRSSGLVYPANDECLPAPANVSDGLDRVKVTRLFGGSLIVVRTVVRLSSVTLSMLVEPFDSIEQQHRSTPTSAEILGTRRIYPLRLLRRRGTELGASPPRWGWTGVAAWRGCPSRPIALCLLRRRPSLVGRSSGLVYPANDECLPAPANVSDGLDRVKGFDKHLARMPKSPNRALSAQEEAKSGGPPTVPALRR
jgi:hypothetical protein